ncbi:gluconate 2-dehydrogenase subunit 3 family protein [Salinarchaeum chitinilyticum]
MKLTRRDAAAALAALGSGGAVALGARQWQRSVDDGTAAGDLADDEQVRRTMVAAAAVLYPSEVTGIEPFVEGFLAGRIDREGHGEGLRRAVAELDELARAWYDAPVAELPPEDRDALLRETGADGVDEAPDGSTAERIRYYVVNDLLLALYTSPTGGKLVGIENPQGHPGGLESYQRGPNG